MTKKITSIEAVDKNGKVWHWTHGASQQMLDRIKADPTLTVTKINGREVKEK